jgi:3-deoxy-D-manno-octulosonic-acid transferase/heptosyltransferase-1
LIARSPRILIVKLSAIGDVVHTLPALNALRRHYPKAYIAWLVEEAAADLIKGHPALDRVLVSQRKTWLAGLKTPERKIYLNRMMDFVKQLRDTRYDMIFDFQASLKGAILIALVRGRSKIGFGPGMEHQEHSYLALNHRIPMISMETHALERGLLMLHAVGISQDAIEYRLPIDQQSRLKARAWIETSCGNAKQKPIAINPMAKWETKLWPLERFAQLADQLIERFQIPVCFTGSPGDRPPIESIIKSMHHEAANLAGRTSLIELAAFYQQMSCLVSTDTGPMHIAAAVGTPVVAIFGPTAPWRTGPYGQGHKVVTADLPCKPCFKRTCDTTGCMASIKVDDVFQQVATVLGINRARR